MNLLSKIDEGHERFSTVHDFTMKDITNMTVRSVSSKSIIFEMGLIIIDRCKSMVIEPKENTSRRAVDHIGLVSYSNSLQISRSYASIFDTVWNQDGLYKQLKAPTSEFKLTTTCKGNLQILLRMSCEPRYNQCLD